MKLAAGLLALSAATATPSALAATRPELRWGADAVGGAPYVFQDPKNLSRIIGFEYDIASAIAKALGRDLVFVQNQWDGLVPGLQRGDYDIAMNGIEITAARSKVVDFSIPYYRTFEQFTVRKDSPDFQSIAELKDKPVGTLKASLAERILKESGIAMDIRSYLDLVPAYEDLLHGRTEAVLMDAPIAQYYGISNPRLRNTGPRVGVMDYGIAVRKGNEALLAQINATLQRLEKTGELRAILEKWALWNPLFAQQLGDFSPSTVAPTAYREFTASLRFDPTWGERLNQYARYFPTLARGALVTLELTVLGMLIAVMLGLALALTRLYAPLPLSWLATTYIETVRGTPLLIQLFLIFYGLPNIGIKLTPFLAAICGLGLNYAAYEAENYRAGILSVPRHQMDAALALGLNRFQALRHIIVPQAMRLVLPPITNDFISLLKDSSLVSIITMVELTKAYSQLASASFDYLGLGILTAAMYFGLGIPFVRLARAAEQHFSIDARAEDRLREATAGSAKKKKRRTGRPAGPMKGVPAGAT